MSDQDRIAEIMCQHIQGGSLYADERGAFYKCRCGARFDVGTASGHRAHLAAEIADALHPRIDTVEQLDALPAGVVVIDDRYDVLQRESDAAGWLMAGFEGWHVPVLPAIVLYTPEVEQ